jgi:multidrug resistance efflux pump
MSLVKGQLIGDIARPNGLAVAFQLSEADANRVRPGQHVEITGPGFDSLVLDGTVATVAGEAVPESGSEGSAVAFAASARLHPLTAAQAAVVRIGMSAALSIDLYRNPNALVAPAASIQGAGPDTFVMVKDAGGNRRVPVRIGEVAADEVEVLSGLKPGDVVVWSASSPDGD